MITFITIAWIIAQVMFVWRSRFVSTAGMFSLIDSGEAQNKRCQQERKRNNSAFCAVFLPFSYQNKSTETE
jgi:hypothetical protein